MLREDRRAVRLNSQLVIKEELKKLIGVMELMGAKHISLNYMN